MEGRRKISDLIKARTLILALAILGFLGLNLAGYLALTHRKINAEVRLASAPLSSTANALHKSLSLRVAVANVVAPIKAYNAYQGIAALLAQNFGLPLELVATRSYAEINDLLRKGEVDLAFVCAGSPASAPDAMDVVAAELVKGKPLYYALVIVPTDSPAQSILDLEGKKFLFTDPNSLTGYWYPVRRLKELGRDPQIFFSQTQWTQTHDRSIQAIAQKMAEGASVNSVIYDLILSKDPALADRVRILERSEPFPSPPVAVRKNLPIKERNLAVQTLVHLKDTPEGKALLAELGIDGFVPATNSDYAVIQPLWAGETDQ